MNLMHPLVHSERLAALYSELPPLERLLLRSVHLGGSTVKLRVEPPRFPDRAPEAWGEAGCDRFEAQLAFVAVEDLRMRGMPDRTAVHVEVRPYLRSWEQRIGVAVRGVGLSMEFTAYADVGAGHLNAYRSGDGDLSTARRWFESRIDQHLHQVLPPTTTKVFYE